MKNYIIIHHSAVSREKNSNQFDAIERYHASKGWGQNTGYHYLIESDGTIKQGRKENEIGAHCKEDNKNYDSIGICLTGNFDIEKPTVKQIKSLFRLIKDIKTRHDIKEVNGHRKYATYKLCPGVLFTDTMIKFLNKDMKIIIGKCKDICKIADVFENDKRYTEMYNRVDLARFKVMKKRASQIADFLREFE